MSAKVGPTEPRTRYEGFIMYGLLSDLGKNKSKNKKRNKKSSLRLHCWIGITVRA